MKNNYFVLLVLCILSSSCSNAEKIFKGEIKIVEKPVVDRLIGEKIELDGLYAGNPIIFDSIISFVYYYDNYFVSNFDIKTGKHLGNVLNRGQGPEEFLTIVRLHPGSGYGYWFSDFKKRHYVLVDMLSGKEKKRIDLSDYRKEGNIPFISALIINDSLLIAVNQTERKNLEGETIVPKLSVINYITKEKINTFEMYDENLYNKLQATGKDNEHLLASYLIKPDKSKIVSIMNRLFQINILDLKTGEWKGFRIEGTPGFDFVRSPLPPTNHNFTYYFDAVDDEYIYAMVRKIFDPDTKPIIHVFDWSGNFVRILETNQKGVTFNLDRVNKKLYFKDADEDENVWVYDVSYLYK